MVASFAHSCTVLIVVFLFVLSVGSLRQWDDSDIRTYREKVRSMFYHAYDGYIKYAYPFDELRPITCDGYNTWGSYSLTLVDALDTLAIIGNYSEFRRVAELVMQTLEFDLDVNTSVFETNIRIVGGLLSAHLMSKRAGLQLEPGWPCSGPLLRLAENVARKLLPAFNSTTGMPYGTVNLRHGVPKGETAVTCTAGVGTFMVEFGTLSRLTGDPVFENTAVQAMQRLWSLRSDLGLVGNHIDVNTGLWTALDSGIGAGVDSYFEYLVKGSILFQRHDFIEMFHDYEKQIERHLKRDDWYMWANMKKGSITLPMFQSLEAFWPGLQSLVGDVDKGMKTIHNYHQVWRQFGFTPEFYNIVKQEPHIHREGYPLRPELIESAMYLYQATKDPYLLDIGADIVESIEHSARTKCGYATVKDVRNHSLDNRMESFFLAETTKYLYLLFDPDNFIHNNGNYGDLIHTPNGDCIIDAGGYVFNTEAHPIDVACLYCCGAQRNRDLMELQQYQDNIDLLQVLDLVDVEQTPVRSRKSENSQDPDNELQHAGNSNAERKGTETNEKIGENFVEDEIEEEKHIEEIVGENPNGGAVESQRHSSESNTLTKGETSEDNVEHSAQNVKDSTAKDSESVKMTSKGKFKVETKSVVIESDLDLQKVAELTEEDVGHAKPREHVFTCPAAQFTQRLSVLGEMFVDVET